MTRLLETAIAKARDLPRRHQDRIARHLLEYVEEHPDRVSIEEIRDAFDAGDFLTIERWRRELGFETS